MDFFTPQTLIVDTKEDELSFKVADREIAFKIAGGNMYVRFSDITSFIGIDTDYYRKKEDYHMSPKYPMVKFPPLSTISTIGEKKSGSSGYISTGTLLRFLSDIMAASKYFKEGPDNKNKVGIHWRTVKLYEIFK